MYLHGTHQISDDGILPGSPGYALSRRVVSDYEEMPGLSVTLSEAVRLWGASVEVSEQVLASLVATGYLRNALSGYVRALELRSSSVHPRWEHLL